ncbi:ankyrin repeat domain-containing protein 29-like isoform X1 [Hyperolius riggenbachi]|uniref:ankyrin repeat domain-containing protein 29-like isoform X1 n=2 Tax=Hyperolius riggenbachi TaxID=752182 RepID=UPI0035A2C133
MKQYSWQWHHPSSKNALFLGVVTVIGCFVLIKEHLYCVYTSKGTWKKRAQWIATSKILTGTTALMVASYAGHTQCVRELVLHGADINLHRDSGATALFFAAQQGHNDIVKFLFEYGASTEFTTRDGGTAMLTACQHGHCKVVETLLKNGANINDQLCDGATPLFLAAQGGFIDVVRLLLTYGAKANQPRQDGTTALWIAAQLGYSEVVRVLLLRGADRDTARMDGTSPLFKAAAKGFSDVIEELLKFSPALGMLKNGSTALHAAVLGGSIRSVALLLEAGAIPTIRNKANELPADLTKNERILRLLKSKETKSIQP